MEEHKDFIKNWLEGKISREELQSRKDKGDADVRDLDELVTRSRGLRMPAGALSDEEAWQRLSGKLTETGRPEARVVKMRWIPLSVAAAVSLLVVAFFLLDEKTVVTPMAETKVQLLPDGSEVTLNADSKIEFPRLTWSLGREVKLKGEAFFKVKPGSTFVVETDRGMVTVLGTSFNMNARAAAFEVACYTGKVNVSSGQGSVLLTQGMVTALGADGLAPAVPFDANKADWRTGDFYFDSKPLHMVMHELERQFNVEIVFSGDSTRLYTGYFSNQDADQAFDMVFKPMSLQYRRENPNKIVVR